MTSCGRTSASARAPHPSAATVQSWPEPLDASASQDCEGDRLVVDQSAPVSPGTPRSTRAPASEPRRRRAPRPRQPAPASTAANVTSSSSARRARRSGCRPPSPAASIFATTARRRGSRRASALDALQLVRGWQDRSRRSPAGRTALHRPGSAARAPALEEAADQVGELRQVVRRREVLVQVGQDPLVEQRRDLSAPGRQPWRHHRRSWRSDDRSVGDHASSDESDTEQRPRQWDTGRRQDWTTASSSSANLPCARLGALERVVAREAGVAVGRARLADRLVEALERQVGQRVGAQLLGDLASRAAVGDHLLASSTCRRRSGRGGGSAARRCAGAPRSRPRRAASR